MVTYFPVPMYSKWQCASMLLNQFFSFLERTRRSRRQEAEEAAQASKTRTTLPSSVSSPDGGFRQVGLLENQNLKPFFLETFKDGFFLIFRKIHQTSDENA